MCLPTQSIVRTGVPGFLTTLEVRCSAEGTKGAGAQPVNHGLPHGNEERSENSSHEKVLSLINTLKGCGKHKDLCKGMQIHADALKLGCLTEDSVVGKSLLYMYAKCGSVAKAQHVFDECCLHDILSWTSLLAGYADMGFGERALDCFEQMQQEGHSPDAVAFACVLKACSSAGLLEKAEELHNQVLTNGLLGRDLILDCTLVDMYTRFGKLPKAKQVLEQLPIRNEVIWNALISGYCRYECGKEILYCVEQMKREGFFPTAVTFACTLKACGSLKAVEMGKQLHSEIITKGILFNNSVLGSALMDMYIKCGELSKAHQVFDELPVRDIVSWTSLITGYCQNGLGEEALCCLEQMKQHNVAPNEITFACVSKVCGLLGAAEKGKQLHAEILRKGWTQHDTVLGNALIYMYAKCGLLSKAQEVFDELLVRSIVSWTSLISGFCEKGYGEEALNCFESMKHEGFYPDAIVFSSILKACATIGDLEKGQTYFDSMTTRYGIVPSLEHRTCLVNLLCRVGQFDQAILVIGKMPSIHHFPSWFALLGACRKWGTVNLGKLAFNHAVQNGEKPLSPCNGEDVADAQVHKKF